MVTIFNLNINQNFLKFTEDHKVVNQWKSMIKFLL